jgi:hypothetical protein
MSESNFEETPHIFGKPMEALAQGVTHWQLEVAGIAVCLRKFQGDRLKPWLAYISTPYGPDGFCETMSEAVEFLEAELRKMRARFVEEVPGP